MTAFDSQIQNISLVKRYENFSAVVQLEVDRVEIHVFIKFFVKESVFKYEISYPLPHGGEILYFGKGTNLIKYPYWTNEV